MRTGRVHFSSGNSSLCLLYSLDHYSIANDFTWGEGERHFR